MPKFFISAFLLFFTIGLKAQTWELGGNIGGSGYMGDLNQNNPVKVSGYAISGFVKRNFDRYLSVKLNYTLGAISAADSNSNNAQFKARNLSFTTTLSEVSAMGEFNFMEYIPEVGKNRFTPYIFFGVSAVNYFPSTKFNGKTYALRGYKTEGEKTIYPTTAFSLPYGVGIKYNILGKFTIMADIGYRNPNTDYLDDVSGLYPAANKSTVFTDRSGQRTGVFIGTPGSQRGDSNPRDTYFFLQVGLSYTFVTQKCYF